MKEHFDEFFAAYLECALWSSTTSDDVGTPLDQDYTEENIAPEALDDLRAIARVFWFRNSCYLAALDWGREDYTQYQLAGHDLWLTQNGHGTGFRDRDHWEPYRDMFTKQAKNLGEIDLIIGDDGLIYA